MILKDQVIVVTGGTGSLGKTLINRILTGELGTPKKVIVFSRDEAKQHDMRMSFLHKAIATDEVIYRNFLNILEFRIGDIRNYADVCSAIKHADIIINAAALKQVPACEYFPHQAVLTNCMGASNIVRAIEENSLPVKTVVGISTDKACKPVNAMGLTKAIQERIFIAANVLNPKTRFIGVRYGNVLASRGSVIPLFHDQIRNGGPVTVTTTDMTRFLLSLNQAVDTVFAALRTAEAGEIYVPRAPAASIFNVVKALIEERKIEIKVTGIRPGEKIHEIMVSDEEAVRCVVRENWYSIRPMLPELESKNLHVPAGLKKEYSSGDEVLDLQGTRDLLIKNKLMINDIQDFNSNTTEILR